MYICIYMYVYIYTCACVIYTPSCAHKHVLSVCVCCIYTQRCTTPTRRVDTLLLYVYVLAYVHVLVRLHIFDLECTSVSTLLVGPKNMCNALQHMATHCNTL